MTNGLPNQITFSFFKSFCLIVKITLIKVLLRHKPANMTTISKTKSYNNSALTHLMQCKILVFAHILNTIHTIFCKLFWLIIKISSIEVFSWDKFANVTATCKTKPYKTSAITHLMHCITSLSALVFNIIHISNGLPILRLKAILSNC